MLKFLPPGFLTLGLSNGKVSAAGQFSNTLTKLDTALYQCIHFLHAYLAFCVQTIFRKHAIFEAIVGLAAGTFHTSLLKQDGACGAVVSTQTKLSCS